MSGTNTVTYLHDISNEMETMERVCKRGTVVSNFNRTRAKIKLASFRVNRKREREREKKYFFFVDLIDCCDIKFHVCQKML